MKVSLSRQEVLNYLNGFLCIYKQKDVSLPSIKKLLMKKISNSVNALEPAPIPMIERPIVEAHPKTGALLVVGLRKQLDYTLHPLCGSALRQEDILFDEVEPMETKFSGVCLFAVNNGSEKVDQVRDAGWVSKYMVNGVLGEMTHKQQLDSKVTQKADYDHVTRARFEKLLTRTCHQYRRLSYELSNVDLQSEEAFEIAQSGAIRPKVLGTPIVYDIQLVHFEPPSFQLKIACASENDTFLRALIQELGVMLDTTARPTRLQRVQFGPFLRSHALLDKYFQLPTIIKNIAMCNKIIETQLASANDRNLKIMNKNESLSYVKEYYLEHEHLQKDYNSAIEDGLEDGDAFNIQWGRNYE